MPDACATRGTKSPWRRGWRRGRARAVVWNDATPAPSTAPSRDRTGRKVDRPEAAGRFGLGFNAVYHYGRPSFVSGEFLVMFDPHATHLPGATPARPGLKIQFAKGDLLAQFPDQFAPYADVFGCDLKTKYDATMFRFPLRTEASAKTSEIKPEAYTADAVRRLFAAFKDRAAETLLFLKHVRKIGVYERRSERGAPELLYEARASGFEGGADPRRSVLRGSAAARGRREGGPKAFAKLRSTPTRTCLERGWMDLELRQAGPYKRGTREGGDPRSRDRRGRRNTHASSSPRKTKRRRRRVADGVQCSPAATSGAALGRRRNARPGAAGGRPPRALKRTPTLDTTEGAVETLAP